LIGIEIFGFEFDIDYLLRNKRIICYIIKKIDIIYTKIIITSILLLILKEWFILKTDIFLCGKFRAEIRCTWFFLIQEFEKWFRNSREDSDEYRYLLFFLKMMKLSLINVNDLID
jgi:hypothetical protein